MKPVKYVIQIKSALLVDIELGDLILEIDPKHIDEKLLEELR